MADDLDAFFEEVSAVEQEAAKEDKYPPDQDDNNKNGESPSILPPPSKKIKTNTNLPPHHARTKGVVVAAASSKVIIPKDKDEHDEDNKTQKTISGIATVGPAVGPTASSLQLPPASGTVVAPGMSNGNTTVATASAPVPSSFSSKPHVRTIAGKTWVDSSLSEWPENDFRLFVGNIAPDVTDEALFQHFATRYASCQRAKIIRETTKASANKGVDGGGGNGSTVGNVGVSKGYGFVSLSDALECAKAIREMDQSWLSSRPIKVKRSTWKEREMVHVKKKEKKNQKLQKRLGIL